MVVLKICIKLCGFDYKVLDQFVSKIVDMVWCIGVDVSGFVLFFICICCFIVLCSFFKYKDSCEYFEICIYNCLVDIMNFIKKIIDFLMIFDLFIGVDIEIKIVGGCV